MGWTGYKVHLTETCDDDSPHLLTQVETTVATETDVVHLAVIHAGTGYDVAHFQIDWDAAVVTVRKGSGVCAGARCRPHGRSMIHVDFAPGDCLACSARAQCTRAKERPRSLTLLSREEHAAMQAARQLYVQNIPEMEVSRFNSRPIPTPRLYATTKSPLITHCSAARRRRSSRRCLPRFGRGRG